MTEGESGDTAVSGAPRFDDGRRRAGRSAGALPVDVALDPLRPVDLPDEPPRRRWTDGEPDDAPAPPRLNFQKAQPPTPAYLIDDPAADAINAPKTPRGGPQFLGRGAAAEPPPDRRRTRGAQPPDIPPPGTRISAWSRSGPVVTLKSPHAGRGRRVAMRLVALVCVCVIGIFGYPLVTTLIRERSVPPALRPYVDGKGVQYAPAGQGFAARLPKQPVHRDGALAAADGKPALFVQRSIVAGAGYEIVIRVVDVPDGMPLPLGAVGVLGDRRISGAAAVNVRKGSFAGVEAFSYEQRSSSTVSIHSVVLLRSQRLYLVSVQSKAANVVLETLSRSFRFTP